jgi:hypothetical protein
VGRDCQLVHCLPARPAVLGGRNPATGCILDELIHYDRASVILSCWLLELISVLRSSSAECMPGAAEVPARTCSCYTNFNLDKQHCTLRKPQCLKMQ